MITSQRGIAVALVAFLAGAVLDLTPASSRAAEPPVKLVLDGQIGREVDATTKGDVCTVESLDVCQSGKETGSPSSISAPVSVAAAPDGNFYVAEHGYHRVEEFTAEGLFVLMFGKEVNETAHLAHEAGNENVCPVKPADQCKAGNDGRSSGQFDEIEGIAVDPKTEDIYIAEYDFGSASTVGERLQEFMPDGRFVMEVGREVDKTTHRNICTHIDEESGHLCGEPGQLSFAGGVKPTTEHEVFTFAQEVGDLIAIGGEHGYVYVGELSRIQELGANGEWLNEISTPDAVEALAVDGKTNDLDVVYQGQATVHQLDSSGKELRQIPVAPTVEEMSGLAVDKAGHLAVAARIEAKERGFMFNANTGKALPGFTSPEPSGAAVTGLSFGGGAELMYMARLSQSSIAYFKPEPVAEPVITTHPCDEEVENSTSVLLSCTLGGEVNPYNVGSTEARFEWELESVCEHEPVEMLGPFVPVPTTGTPLSVDQVLTGLRPKERVCYRVVAVDEHVQVSEEVTGETREFTTPAVPPKVVGAPNAPFVGATFAVMTGELNPERSATEFFFELAKVASEGEEPLSACPGVKVATCAGVQITPVGSSSLYRRTGITLEAAGLQPGSAYEYRLAAANEAGERVGQASVLTTSAAPNVSALTGSPASVTATSAVLSGSIDPDGAPATYSFELGEASGGVVKQLGVVASGPTGAGAIGKAVEVTDLQPNTEYGYRISIASGYGHATGAVVTFHTEPVSAGLAAPPAVQLLPVTLGFPPAPCKKGYARNKHGVCVKTRKPKKAKNKSRSKKKSIKGTRRRVRRGQITSTSSGRD